jgi:hypothetical protein
MISRFRFIGRFLLILALAFTICMSGQAAEASHTGTGRLVVYRSPKFGSKVFLQLWIDGRKVGDIGPGHRYDELIPAGNHVLAVNYTPRTKHQPTPMRLTVHPGETYAFTAVRDSLSGVTFQKSNRIPP